MRHAGSFFGTGAAKGSTTRAKMGTSRDINCRRSCKREHDTRKEGCDTRHLLPPRGKKEHVNAQRWGRHATSIATGRAKESASRAKMGATRDIFCFRCGKRWHDRRKSSVVSRGIVYNNPKRRLSENSPPQPRRGGRDINKNIAKPPLMERTGWCWSRKCLIVDQHHPVCAGLGGFAAFS